MKKAFNQIKHSRNSYLRDAEAVCRRRQSS